MSQLIIQKLKKNLLLVILIAMLIGASLAALVGVYTDYFARAADSWKYQLGEVAFDSGYLQGREGECVNWNPKNLGNRVLAKCHKAHRFEISGQVTLPKQYGENALYPKISEWERIQTQLCVPNIKKHFGKKYDPNGRFTVAALLPTPKQWEAGYRHITCGVQIRNYHNEPVPEIINLPLREMDQSAVFNPGTCLNVARSGFLKPVNCKKKHFYEVSRIFSLDNQGTLKTLNLPVNKQPSVDEQNNTLENYCYFHSSKFFGEKPLKQSGLLVTWIPIEDASWQAGSHKSMCLITAYSDQKIQPIEGSLRDKGGVLIAGKAPSYTEEAPPGRSIPRPVDIPIETGL